MYSARLATVPLLLVLLPACLVGGSSRDWEFSDVDAASIRLTNGEAYVATDTSRRTAWVAYDGGGIGTQAVRPTIDAQGGMLVVDAAGGLLSGGELEVELPGGVPIDAFVQRGELTLSLDEPSHVRACVNTGALTIELPAGAYALDLDAGAGDITVDGIIDDPNATTAIQARVGAGSLTLVGISGGS